MLNAEPPLPAENHSTRPQCAYLGINSSQRFHSSEFDTSAMCRVVDVLAELGVEVLSLNGTGEPLVRDDFDQIINHASVRGLRVHITSNGRMPRTYYQRLLASRVDEITIAVDPLSPAATAIHGNLRFLHNHLPPGKSLTIRVDLPWTKRSQFQAILEETRLRYPRATVRAGNEAIPGSALMANVESTLVSAAFAPPPPPSPAMIDAARAALHA